jgi:hypothetical protein
MVQTGFGSLAPKRELKATVNIVVECALEPDAYATLAFTAGSIRRRFAPMPFSQELDQSYQGFDSKSWSSFLGPL